MITVNELFSGIGAFRKALMRMNIPHSVVGISEIDQNAINSYNAIYGDTRNYGDIAKIEKLDYADLWTYGFPCQDISIAGQQKGIIKGETRSGLLYEVQRLLEHAKADNELPKYLILENVKNLTGKKHNADFQKWLEWLSELGYDNHWKVLNAKNFIIPQQRERVFVVSIRKDIKCNFEFPVDTTETTKSFMEYVDTELTEQEEKLAYLEWADLEKMKDFEAGYSFGGYIDKSPIYRTITARYGKITGNSGKFFRNHRVSCLTPKECWRLMGFDDEDYLKAEKVCGYKQLYKQAGNSIVVTILESLMTNLLSCESEEPTTNQEKTRSQWLDELLGGI